MNYSMAIAPSPKIRQSSIQYAGLLGSWVFWDDCLIALETLVGSNVEILEVAVEVSHLGYYYSHNLCACQDN